MCCPPASTNEGSRPTGREPTGPHRPGRAGRNTNLHKCIAFSAVLPAVLSVNVNAPSVGFTDFNHSTLMKILSEVEAAYVAGIIDGEGTVTLTRTHRGENRRPVVSISSTELQLLTYVQSVIGAGRITGKACAREHHSPSFAYCITSRQALALLAQVYPFLRTYKSRRACLLLEEYQRVTPRNGRYTAELLAARAQLEARFFAISTRAGTPRRVAH
jgi:LAGLIDADG-like domain